MATATAARSIFRSAARLANRIGAKQPTSSPAFRSPVELSFGVESMLPYHTARASALMTSMQHLRLASRRSRQD